MSQRTPPNPQNLCAEKRTRLAPPAAVVSQTEQIRQLHYQVSRTVGGGEARADAAFSLVWTHCQIVASIAYDFAVCFQPRPDVWAGAVPDPERTYLGGLVHDIGVYRVYLPDGSVFDHARYLFHGLEGFTILRDASAVSGLAGFARNHTGLGITHDDIVRQGLPLPPADYVPQTIEEEMVLFADKFHTKSTPPTFVSAGAARASAARFGEENAQRFDALRQRYGVPDVATLAAVLGESVR